ncbi:MAG: hypothetical protein NC906_07110 [Candidatus Omnitrophica bacterium]|nr:hypothetical protein [Candidatus Omnitrophota bacterium]MCM8817264.1 hypothetical protein [Candidatus Omnitrophota bacterium]
MERENMNNEFPGIALNEDNSHYFFTRAYQKLDPDKVASWVDQYAKTQVKEIMICPNCMRTSYDSSVWEPIWKGYNPELSEDQALFASLDPEERKAAIKWVHTAWRLAKDGIDVYKVWIKRCRELGISPWISMRMNDVHSVNDVNAFLHSTFWRENPQFYRVPYRFSRGTDRAFDYSRKEVRQHHMKLIEELFERYDFDGFELDWMRFGYHFRPGFETQGVQILNEFMKDVRKLADYWEEKRSHRIKLSARVPRSYETSLGLGMDPVFWAKNRLVDMIVITPFWATIDNDMPVETWKGLLEGTNTILAAGFEVLIRPYPMYNLHQTNSLETVRGSAASYLDRGVDRIYLFNYMDSMTAMEDVSNYPTLLREIGDLRTIVGKKRRHVITYQDTFAPGMPKGYLLPCECKPNVPNEFRVHIGPKPDFEKVIVLLGIENNVQLESNSLEVRLNGEICNFKGTFNIEKPCPEFPLYGYEVLPNAVNRGYNLIEVTSKIEVKIGWVEILILPEVN